MGASCLLAAIALSATASSAFAQAPDPRPEAAPAAAPTAPALAPPAESAAFRAAMKAKAAAAQKNFESAVTGREGWLFFAPELRHLGVGRWWGADAAKASQSVDPANADPLPAILDFKAQLDRAGIELLLVPVPPKAVIYADKIGKPRAGTGRLDALHVEFYDLLRRNGVRVLDLTEEFLVARDNPPDPVYCRTDTHWSGRACALAAQRIVGEFKGSAWLPAPKKYTFQWRDTLIDGDLRAALPKSKRGPQEKVLLSAIGQAGKPLADDKNSPVILLGDSHTLVFHEGGDMHARGAGLADQLAYRWGFPLDVVGVRGSGATPARVNLLRRAKADKTYLARKKLVIWCFSAREWTESLGWNKVPVVPE